MKIIRWAGRFAFFIVGLLGSMKLHATIKLPYFFSSHMVLQRNTPLRIWGQANPNEHLIIRFHRQAKQVEANADGNWMVSLQAEKAGGPYTLAITAEHDSLRFDDVLIGDVWICSGQSNMEWVVADVKDANKEIASANYPNIRQFDVPNRVSFTPQWNTGPASWQICTPASVGRFTAVGYFFARKLYSELHVPIGLINCTWGGTVAEAWVSSDFLARHPDFKSKLASQPKNETEYMAGAQKRYEALIQKFQGQINYSDDKTWSLPSFNDDSWPSLGIDKLWEDQSLPDFDGAVWYRIKVNITEEQANADAILHLGTIDDDDSTWLNGRLVGVTKQWNAERHYTIKKGELHAGVNALAVKVWDYQGGGGFYGNAEKAFSFSNGTKVMLPVQWKAQISAGDNLLPRNPNEVLSSLYNGMIHPLVNYVIRGAIWYQGEANVDRAKQYETLFPLLIRNWREKWKLGNFPFYFVQLSSYDPDHKPLGTRSTWAELRDAQRKTLSVPNTGMAVTIDIGDRDDIHPRDKQDVGLRLALIALKNIYGFHLLASGPTKESVLRNGDMITVKFSNAGSGLVTKGDPVGGFELIDKQNKVYQANARVEHNRVVVLVPKGVQPVVVRYGWRDDAGDANLFNKEGLPAMPFEQELK